MSPVKPIPDGMSAVIPHLVVNDAARAIDFYKKAFGAEERGRFNTPDGKIMHASIAINGSSLFLNDAMMGAKDPIGLGGSPVALMIYVNDVDATFQRAVSAGATATMPVADQFWGDRYGMLKDPFGHTWEIATHKEDLSPEEMDRRGKEAMAQMPQR
jgi:PhnB protein